MKIGILSYEYPPETSFGGIGTYSYYQARALVKLGHQVHVFAGSTKKGMYWSEIDGVRITRIRREGFLTRWLNVTSRRKRADWPRVGWPGAEWAANRLETAKAAYSALAHALRRESFDILEMPECGADGAIVNTLVQVPTAVRFHSPARLIMDTYDTSMMDRKMTEFIEQIAINQATVHTSCSQFVADEVAEKMHLAKPIYVIPNGIDLEMFDRDDGIDVHEKFGIPKDRITVFFANRLERRKGIHLVRDMAFHVLKKYPNVSFVFAGRDLFGFMDREIMPFIREHGLKGSFHYLGGLDLASVRAILKKTSIFLVASLWENCPYSCIEAMAAGATVVSSDCGGMPELIQHRQNGLLARNDDSKSFIQALEEAIEDPALRQRLSAAARKTVETRLTDVEIARRSVELYSRVLKGSARRLELLGTPLAAIEVREVNGTAAESEALEDVAVTQAPAAAAPVATAPAGPICTAPFAMLAVDPDGTVRGCEYGLVPLAEEGPAPLTEAWSSEFGEKLRCELAAGTFERPHCARCADRVAEASIDMAAPRREYGTLAPAPAGAAPARLLLRFNRRGDKRWPATVLQDVCSLVPRAAEVELDGDLGGPDARAVVSVLRKLHAAREPAPRITVRVRSFRSGRLAKAALAALPVVRVRCLAGEDWRQSFPLAAELAARTGATIDALVVVGPGNWFDVEELARACSAQHVALRLEAREPDGQLPLAGLPLEEFRVAYNLMNSWWGILSGDARPAAIDPGDLAHILSEVRSELKRRTLAARYQAESALRGSGATLAFPSLDHPILQDPARALAIVRQLAPVPRAASVVAWVQELAAASSAVQRARRRPWFRHLLLKTAMELHRAALELPAKEELFGVLRKVYAPERSREDLLREDTALQQSEGLADAGRSWFFELGLEPHQRRSPPFQVPRPTEPRLQDAADVTVLIPSFKHESFIAEALQSVLAQTHPGVRVLVADDASPDATVERARAVLDPRIDVIVNEQNVGLGNTVLRALEHVKTPYVALLNSDDLFHPERVARCVAVLADSPKANLVATGVAVVDARGGRLTPGNVSMLLDGRNVADWVRWYAAAQPRPGDATPLFERLLEHNFLATSSNLVCRTDWLRGQSEALASLKYCLDWQLFLDAAVDDGLVLIPDELVAYRLHSSNTVWFQEGRRWPYYLEVNRVAAHALRRFVAARAPEREGGPDLERVVRAVVSHLAANSEIDGLAVFLNQTVPARQLDAETAESEPLRRLVEELNLRAETDRRRRDVAGRIGEDAPRVLPDVGLIPYLKVMRILSDVYEEEAVIVRGAEAWAKARVGELEGVIGGLQEARQRAEREWERTKRTVQQREKEARERVAQLEEVISGLVEDLQRMGLLEGEFADGISGLRALRTEIAGRWNAILARNRAIANDRDRLTKDLESRGEELGRMGAEHHRMKVERTALASDRDRLAAELEQTRREHREELERLRRTREWRTGNLVWNKLKLAEASRRGKKWYRKALDLKARTRIALGKTFRGKTHVKKKAVVAACWHFPIYSHTFVYQEMMGLLKMGMDLELFCWHTDEKELLHGAFSYLWDHRIQLQPVVDNHLRDMDHFRKTRPGRLESFLQRLAVETGKSVEDLEREPRILQGCTFARMADLEGADYLHTYFFYEQSLMAMLTAWLLEIPRGISCYADHMMDDYEFKLIPLHMETADVVVATSRRIKRELLQISGGRFADKVIVKPNGVDGARFPSIDRGASVNGAFNLLSISRIEPKKGLHTLVEAVQSLKQRGRPVKVHVVGTVDPASPGSVEFADRFNGMIAELGLEDSFVLHGFKRQEDLGPILGAAQVFVAPYVEVESGDKDGIPTSMLEAMASGLPVVTTDSGSITEVVDDGVEGFLVPQRNAERLADAIQRLIDDPALRSRLARAARVRFEREFDAAVTDKLLHAKVDEAIRRKEKERGRRGK